jgi:hypothetical protein
MLEFTQQYKGYGKNSQMLKTKLAALLIDDQAI